METVLGQSMSPLPMSYKEALERLEQSKVIELANLSKTLCKKLAERAGGGISGAGSVMTHRNLQPELYTQQNS